MQLFYVEFNHINQVLFFPRYDLASHETRNTFLTEILFSTAVCSSVFFSFSFSFFFLGVGEALLIRQPPRNWIRLAALGFPSNPSQFRDTNTRRKTPAVKATGTSFIHIVMASRYTAADTELIRYFASASLPVDYGAFRKPRDNVSLF